LKQIFQQNATVTGNDKNIIKAVQTSGYDNDILWLHTETFSIRLHVSLQLA